MDDEHTYKPIPCQLYDQVELLALHKTKVKISFKEEAPFYEPMISSIESTQTLNKTEYIILVNGYKIRMDYIENIDKL